MASARLLLGRGDDPDIVAELARDGLEQFQPTRIDAVVVGEEDAHSASLWRQRSKAATATGSGTRLRHIRNSLAISSLHQCQSLLRLLSLFIAPGWGWPTYPVLSPGKVSSIRLRLHRWPGRSRRRAYCRISANCCGIHARGRVYGDRSSRPL